MFVFSVYPDVPSAFEKWIKSCKIGIYSTGSVESQKLLFAHTTKGDLSPHITYYFDQNIGIKTEKASYENIIKEMSVTAEKVLFVSDNIDGECFY